MLKAAPTDIQASITAHFAKGAALGGQGKWADAIEAYRKCVELDPENSKAWAALGSACFRSGDYNGAIPMYRKTIELDPSHSEGRVWFSLSHCLEKKNDIIGAIKATEEYIRRGDPDGDGEYRLAELRAKLETTQ